MQHIIIVKHTSFTKTHSLQVNLDVSFNNRNKLIEHKISLSFYVMSRKGYSIKKSFGLEIGEAVSKVYILNNPRDSNCFRLYRVHPYKC